MWDLPGPGLKRVSPTLAGGFLTTAPPGKSHQVIHSCTLLVCNKIHAWNIYLFIYFYLFCLFLAALGLPCCVRAFSSCGERGLLFVAVRGLLIAAASLVAEHGL